MSFHVWVSREFPPLRRAEITQAMQKLGGWQPLEQAGAFQHGQDRFWWADPGLQGSSPSSAGLAALLELAQELGGRVIGEDGLEVDQETPLTLIRDSCLGFGIPYPEDFDPAVATALIKCVEWDWSANGGRTELEEAVKSAPPRHRRAIAAFLYDSAIVVGGDVEEEDLDLMSHFCRSAEPLVFNGDPMMVEYVERLERHLRARSDSPRPPR